MFELKKIEAEWRARMHKALSFDGVDDYVQITDNGSLDITGDITVTAWIYPIEPNRGLIFENKYASGHYKGVFLWIQPIGRLEFILGNGSKFAVVESDTTLETKWYFVVGKREGELVELYINGVKQNDTDTLTGDIQYYMGRYIRIGLSSLNAYPFNGLISHVSIYNRALSESEIKYLYHNPFDPIDPEHLVLWLNPAGIDVANSKWWDLSGKGNHGTIHGATEVSLVEEEVKVK